MITGSQGAIIAPVICLESDGHVTVESSCYEGVCNNVTNNGNNNIEKCEDCVDIPLWPYIPEFKQAIKASYQTVDLITYDSIAQHTINAEQNTNCTAHTPSLVTINSQPQLAITYTHLLL
ncbi:MAG: hypothetical protein ISR95_04380 [Candidatus Marinimicrobia bacterium]|nr:hypothetical protein [Candidatus Neomarinimicrobiota bacterium]